MVVHTNKVTQLLSNLIESGFSVTIPDKRERVHLLNILNNTKFLQPETTAEKWLAQDRMLNHPMFLLRYKGKIAAFINFNIRKSNFGHIGYIRSVYVSPEFRGKGLAKKLITIAEYLIPHPYWMLVKKDNRIMLDMTKKMGYSEHSHTGNHVLISKPIA
jgi:ribosomal protein S18 acetylase RimI-like enzyme